MTTIDNCVDAFISGSFRDVADEDYIAARLAYRYELLEPFLWLSLQAVEKYLKAILLFHRESTKPFGHHILKCFEGVVASTSLTFPADIRDFIVYVNEEGKNRYFEYPAELKEDSLIGLDRTVWHLRRYCFPISRAQREFTEYVNSLGSDPLEYRHRFAIPGGYLEKVLAKQSERRRQLVWKNFWFGSRRRRRIRQFPSRMAWRQPVHFMRPEVFAVIEPLVLFDKDVKAHFGSKATVRR